MIFVALVPAVVWVGLLLATGLPLVRQLRRGQHKGQTVNLLRPVLALQGLAGAAAAITTSMDQISWFACRSGVYGTWISIAMALAGLVLLLALFQTWPRNANGTRRHLLRSTLLWIAFSSTALLAHLRSLVLCTV